MVFKLIQVVEMNNSSVMVRTFIRFFLEEEDGAQVVEYALIIAVISIALVIALRVLTTDAGADFETFIGRVKTCLTTSGCA